MRHTARRFVIFVGTLVFATNFARTVETVQPGLQILPCFLAKARRGVNRRANQLMHTFEYVLSNRFQVMVDDVKEAAPWHGWSIYGMEAKGWISASEICTKEVASDMLERGRRSFATTRTFLGRQ